MKEQELREMNEIKFELRNIKRNTDSHSKDSNDIGNSNQ